MIFKRPAPVVLVNLRAERFVLLHDVEHVAQHLVRHDIGFRAHGSGPRVEVHAGHFTEQIAGAKLGDWVSVSEVNGSINGNGAVVRFLGTLVLLAADERTGEALEEAGCPAFGFHVGDGRGNGDLRLAFEYVKGCGTEVTFAADDVAAAKAPADDGALIEVQESSGDSSKDGQLVQFL